MPCEMGCHGDLLYLHICSWILCLLHECVIQPHLILFFFFRPHIPAIMVPVSSFLLRLCIVLSFSLPSDTQSFSDFENKHIVGEGAKINCNQTIKERKIWVENSQQQNKMFCKSHNTFIHDGGNVMKLCAGITQSTFVISKEAMPLTDCLLMKDSPEPPNCAYKQIGETGFINITCENHYPVHFAGYTLNYCASYSPCALTLIAVFLLSQLLL
ncbi:sialic acid-binding lectin [Xenopus tropicalis]|uniref:Sialic acid-binding lectin n=1 Tax=Xenopus tropicalis TaxID=8364 RepID=A0A8J0QJM0_XENTR|nr:sialic acid-binding lectin [Xenopus tropicalis]